MALPDLRINPYVTPYAPGPSQEYDALTEQRIQDYDLASEQSDVLAYQNDSLSSQIAPFEGDKAIANSIMNNTRKQIQDWAAKGDYENMGRAIRKGARDFTSQVTPLLENQKRYSGYLTEMQNAYQKGDIGLDTYTKAKAASLSNYKGLDPNNITGSYFSGFIPSKDINVSDKVDKYLKDWKENGGTKFIMSPDGSYREINWESARPEDIAQAAQEALFGDSEFTGYATTQGAIGNHDRVNQELQNAIRFGAEKYGFYKEKGNLGWMPEYAFNNKKALEFVDNSQAGRSSSTINPNVVTSVFDGTDLDKATGKFVPTRDIIKENGKYYRFTDAQGNPLPVEEYKNIPQGEGAVIAAEQLGYKKIEVSPQEAAKLAEGANERLISMAASKYAKEKLDIGDITESGYYGDPNLRNGWLKLNRDKYTNPKYLEKTYKEYEEARKNSQVIGDNQRFNIETVPGAASEFSTALDKNEVISSLAGQSVGVLAATEEDGGFNKGQVADFNSLLDKYSEQGWELDYAQRNGPLKYDPFHENGGISHSLTFKNDKGNKKIVEVAVEANDRDLKTLNDVNKVIYSGLSSEIPFTRPLGNGQYGQGSIRVLNSTKLVNGKRVFDPTIEIVDSDGRRLGGRTFNHLEFANVYKDAFAPDLVSKYMNTKAKK